MCVRRIPLAMMFMSNMLCPHSTTKTPYGFQSSSIVQLQKQFTACCQDAFSWYEYVQVCRVRNYILQHCSDTHKVGANIFISGESSRWLKPVGCRLNLVFCLSSVHHRGQHHSAHESYATAGR